MSDLRRDTDLLLWAAVGAATFVVVQLSLFALTPSGTGGQFEVPGWFLNSGKNVGVIASAVALVAAVVSARASRWRLASAACSAGAIGAMAVTLFVVGPGNLFPLVIAIGAVVMGGATALGTAGGLVVRALWRRAG